MGDDSYSKGREFESRHRKLGGQFFTFDCYKNCYAVCLKRKKEAGVVPIFKKLAHCLEKINKRHGDAQLCRTYSIDKLAK